MYSSPLATPVVLLAFNRPELTRQVINAIRVVRPKYLFAVFDGPRPGSLADDAKCQGVRNLLNEIDWPCQIRTRFATQNLGCMENVSSGLDWVFRQVEEAIVLEDDCVPAPSFFNFCEVLLKYYRNETRIGHIGGVNFQFGRHKMDASYYFSRYPHCWGWATWRRAWSYYDHEMAGWAEFKELGGLEHLLKDKRERRYWIKVLDSVANGDINSWACRWTLSCWNTQMLSVLPAVNLVTNIGFGGDATHTQEESRFGKIPCEEIAFPLRHPEGMIPFAEADAYTGQTMFRFPGIWQRISCFLRGK